MVTWETLEKNPSSARDQSLFIIDSVGGEVQN